jgi:hypothetical protein
MKCLLRTQICFLHKYNAVSLYNIPSWKTDFFVISYNHKERRPSKIKNQRSKSNRFSKGSKANTCKFGWKSKKHLCKLNLWKRKAQSDLRNLLNRNVSSGWFSLLSGYTMLAASLGEKKIHHSGDHRSIPIPTYKIIPLKGTLNWA